MPTLYPSQQRAFMAIRQFLDQDKVNTFILNGFAGTGKTYLMQELGKWLEKEKCGFTLLASTGRAAAVLRGKTGFAATTVHSELYHFSRVDGDGEHLSRESPIDAFGQMRLLFGLREKDNKKRLYIVDEASMIGSEVNTDTSFAEFGTGRLLIDFLQSIGNNKVIFVGDPCQLPPVGQTFSPALTANWLEPQGRISIFATLEEIVRTKADSGILKLAGHIRANFTQTHYTRYVKIPARGKENITVFDQYAQLLKEYIKRAYKNDAQAQMAICRSNADCKLINRLVRIKKYEVEDAPLQAGDTLLVTQNNHLVPLSNGDFVKVVSVGEKRTRANLNFINVRVKSLLSEKDYEVLLCLDVLNGTQTNISLEQHRTLMIDFSRRMRYKNIRPNSEAYKASLIKDPYLNSLRATYGYAVTCHKAQGGEWDDVYLFLNKGMYRMEHEELFRWWYTAITRAREHLYLHDDWWIC
jgi:ATP-dependent exoDNAse (exonuclease V) alpha subunit